MPLFECTECHCVENTATSNYWERKMDGKPLICSECDPDIGVWHGQFEKHSADGWFVDQRGCLWKRDKDLPPAFKIVGKVSVD